MLRLHGSSLKTNADRVCVQDPWQRPPTWRRNGHVGDQTESVGGEVFGSTDKFEGLGIFFDTYKNIDRELSSRTSWQWWETVSARTTRTTTGKKKN